MSARGLHLENFESVYTLKIFGGIATTLLVVMSAAGVLLSFRASARPDRYPRGDELRPISASTRTAVFGAAVGIAGVALGFLLASTYEIADLAVGAVTGMAADSSRYFIEYRRGIGAYRYKAGEALTLAACLLAGLEWPLIR